MAATIGFTLGEINPREITQGMLREIGQHLEISIPKILLPAKQKCREIIKSAIETSEEYNSMLPGGKLYGEIGRPDIQEILNEIIATILEEIQVIQFPTVYHSDYLIAGFDINILENSYSSLLNIRNTSFISENEGEVDWLKWLLFEGDRKVVIDFTYIDTGRQDEHSRTETGIMVKSSQNWGFDYPEAGTQNDNWLTRAIDTIKEEVESVAIEELGKVF